MGIPSPVTLTVLTTFTFASCCATEINKATCKTVLRSGRSQGNKLQDRAAELLGVLLKLVML
jgi:hypothetical protein